MYAQIVVNRPTHRRPPAGAEPLRGDSSHLATFTYRLPERMHEIAAVGQLVQVPLGASTVQGVISALDDSPPGDLPPGLELRQVIEILDPLPVVTPAQIELARWIAHEYLAPLNQSMRLMLPPGLASRTFVMVSQASASPSGEGLSADETEVLRFLKGRGGQVRLSVLMEQVRARDPEEALHALAVRGLVDAQYTLIPPKPAPPRVRFVRLLADEATISSALPRLGRPSKQADALLTVARQSGAPLAMSQLCDLAGCTEGPVRSLAARGWIKISGPVTWLVALPGAESADLGRAHRQAEVLAALLDRGGPVDLDEFRRETRASSALFSALESKGLVQRIPEEPLVLLALPPEQLLERVIELRGAQKERAVLGVLRRSAGLVWVGGIYAQTGADLGTLRKLAERGLLSLHAEDFVRPVQVGRKASPELTADQAAVWREIQPSMEKATRPILLHGVTGSGKTEIYMRAVQATLAVGRRAIVLVPEISLTPQIVRRFQARFPGRVGVIHGQLSLGQRYAIWDQVRGGEVDVIIGPRSALFAPVSRLGLIVLDEAHDGSYKQTEPIPLPAYHARDVALALGRLAGATVLLGSATPDLDLYYRARQGEFRLLELERRVATEPVPDSGKPPPLPPVRVIDLRQELRAGNRSIFSRALQAGLRETLEAGEQAILFLNRRGAATFVICRDCGYVAQCPRCDIPLTYHRSASPGSSASEQLVCHRCNRHQLAPKECPACGGRRVRYFGLGTERVEKAMRETFPGARLLRWDRDTASGLEHERFLQSFVDHRADVLIGTQMIAKGLDLPLVTLVGVVSADTALHLPDFRAAERTFQLLTQVAGRAGRSYRGGRVIVQTYNPDHYAIQAAAKHDYADYYRQETAHRQTLGYPPFRRMIALRISDPDPDRSRAEARRMGHWLGSEIRRLDVPADLIGPAPCFFGRVRGRYRWQLVILASEPSQILRNVALPRGWQVDVDPITLL